LVFPRSLSFSLSAGGYPTARRLHHAVMCIEHFLVRTRQFRGSVVQFASFLAKPCLHVL
jgi:hypothetical protein